MPTFPPTVKIDPIVFTAPDIFPVPVTTSVAAETFVADMFATVAVDDTLRFAVVMDVAMTFDMVELFTNKLATVALVATKEVAVMFVADRFVSVTLVTRSDDAVTFVNARLSIVAVPATSDPAVARVMDAFDIDALDAESKVVTVALSTTAFVLKRVPALMLLALTEPDALTSPTT